MASAADANTYSTSASPAAASPGGSSTRSAYTIRAVRTPDDLRTTAALFRDYAAWLDIDLSFQSFEDELASLPGKYAPEEGGEILLACLSAAGEEAPPEPVGCVALRDITEAVGAWRASRSAGEQAAKLAGGRRIGEFKRLYVLPAGRSLGIGNALVEQIVDVARAQGYSEVLLDTLPRMQSAQKLYRRLGFRETEKYYNTELEGTIFMSCLLGDDGQGSG
ncbi:putative acetyltransferase protein [Neofusicoccum parvum UCRNP2]|uniref:Putative acetyltransferase protein n=1 Tax=Botryosphaeria parva (strain UCR-NP2) TaxID=1287680 RepID=R1GFY7_BOTPV|nr:putative acetyltransferase protein [Neofusicoccum parvum UCRNP2]